MINITGRKGKLIQLIGISGCINLRTMRAYFNGERRSRSNHLYVLTKKELIRRSKRKGTTIYYLTEKGRNYLLSQAEGFINTSLSTIGNIQENGIESKEEYTIEKAEKTGEVIMEMYKRGFTPFLTEKRDYFNCLDEVDRRGKMISEHYDVEELGKTDTKLRDILVSEEIEYAKGDYRYGVEDMYRYTTGKDRKEKNEVEGPRAEKGRKKKRVNCFYSAREIKTHSLRAEKRMPFKRSRMLGLLLTERRGYFVYYPREKNMRWEKDGENSMALFIQKKLAENNVYTKDMLAKKHYRNLLLVENYEVVMRILINRYEDNMREQSFGDYQTYFCTKEDLDYVLESEYSIKVMEEIAREYQIKNKNGELQYNGKPCIIGIGFCLNKVQHVVDGTTVFCLKSQQELYERYNVRTVCVDKVIEQIKASK